jgi:hypothetical protein
MRGFIMGNLLSTALTLNDWNRACNSKGRRSPEGLKRSSKTFQSCNRSLPTPETQWAPSRDPPPKNGRPGSQIGVGARSTELVALRLLPVIATRPPFGSRVYPQG